MNNGARNIDLQDLRFYFDAQARDRMDVGALSRKSGQVLALRDRLIQLPDATFEATYQTLCKLVDTQQGQGQDDRRSQPTVQAAQNLYQSTAAGPGTDSAIEATQPI